MVQDNSTKIADILTSSTDTWLPQTATVDSSTLAISPSSIEITNQDSAHQYSLSTTGSFAIDVSETVSTSLTYLPISSSSSVSTFDTQVSSSPLTTVPIETRPTSSITSLYGSSGSFDLSSSIVSEITSPSYSKASSSSSAINDQLTEIPSTTGSSNNSNSFPLSKSSSLLSATNSIWDNDAYSTLTIDYNENQTTYLHTTTGNPTTSVMGSNLIESNTTSINDPFLSIFNALKNSTTHNYTSYLTTGISSSSPKGIGYNISNTTRTYKNLSPSSSSSNITMTVSSSSNVHTSTSPITRNTTTLQHVSSSSSSSLAQATTTTNIDSSSSSNSSSSSSTELPSSTVDYSYLEDESALYYVYTQQYDFTDSMTSFTTGFPETITIAKSSVSGEATTSFSIPSSTITANVSMYEKLLNGALDGSESSSKDQTQSHSSKVGTVVGSVVGSIGGVIVAVLLLWWFLRSRKNKSSKMNHDYDKSFSHEIHDRQGYSSTRRTPASSSYINENAIKITTRMSPQMNLPPTKYSATNPFTNQEETQTRHPPPVPLPRKNKIDNFYGPDTQSWIGRNAVSYASSSAESSFADDSTMSSSSIRLGSRYDSPSSNVHSTISNPQGFFREII